MSRYLDMVILNVTVIFRIESDYDDSRDDNE